jgi:hypothetical protein
MLAEERSLLCIGKPLNERDFRPLSKQFCRVQMDRSVFCTDACAGSRNTSCSALTLVVRYQEGGVVKNRVIIAAVILAGVFLVGFIPQYVKANRLDTELQQARQANAGAELRDLIGLAYVQANQKNYGLAAATTTRFFNRVRDMANQTTDPSARKGLESLLVSRDKITAALAKGDAGVVGDLQELFMKTRQATGGSGE